MAGSLLVALCGESGAGKSTTTDLLEQEGFRAYSLSGFLREEAEAKFGKPSRAEVQSHGKAMQEEHGNDYFARRLATETNLLSGGDAVIDGMRNLDEVAFIRDAATQAGDRFVLLAAVLETEQRFLRVTSRSRPGDPANLATFIADDARANGAEGRFQNNAALIAAADIRIENDGDIDALAQKLRSGLSGFRVNTKGGLA